MTSSLTQNAKIILDSIVSNSSNFSVIYDQILSPIMRHYPVASYDPFFSNVGNIS
jgi:hypothetical protein